LNDATPVVRTEPTLRLVPREMIGHVLHIVAESLISVAERSRGEFDAKVMIERFQRGEWQLWVIWDGSLKATLGTELHLNDTGHKQCSVRFCTGSNIDGWGHLISDLETWAKREGCQRLNMWARKGWAKKLPAYKLTHVLLERDLV
jgi:hypothetical protein